ncbi:MAG TPA: hybrid sensor histidine kinase/response regulator [Candidatus Nitrosotalea sp.]|nr:hybrid sensor histidine kinase/response regulator [Candidatus Nitrosotalea sp.]
MSLSPILAVDDDPASLVALEATLRPLGEEIITASSGTEALRALLQRRFGMILLDVRLQDYDGFELARLIRSRPSTRTTPIVFLTAYDQLEETVRLGYQSGAADFIFKPFIPDLLRAKVSVFVELQRHEAGLAELLERQRELNRSQSDFMNMAAHELRTPVTVILGYLSMIADGRFGPTPQLQSRPLEMMEMKARELNRIVENLLTSTRLEADSLRPLIREVDLAALVSRAIDNLRGRSELTGAKVEVDLGSGPLLVCVDPDLITGVMDNLLNNALTYSQGQPRIRIRIRRRDQAVVEIRDWGIGIPGELHERVFERFFRVNEADMAAPAGTGLGLYLSRQMVERNQGRLELARSEPGVGTTMVLYLPLALPSSTSGGRWAAGAAQESGAAPGPALNQLQVVGAEALATKAQGSRRRGRKAGSGGEVERSQVRARADG